MRLPDLEAFSPEDYSRVREHSSDRNPRGAIIIPALNESALIAIALGSIGRALENMDDPVSVIVVDNGSNDNTKSIAIDRGAHVIDVPIQGIARARQMGIDSLPSSVEYILSTDADSSVPPSWIHAYHDLFIKNPEVIAAYGLVRYVFESQPSIGEDIQFSLLMAGSTLVRNIKKTNFVNVGSGANSGYRKSAVQNIGGYRTNLKSGEDLELFRRLREAGQIDIVDAPVMTSNRRIAKRGYMHHLYRRLTANIYRLLKGKYPNLAASNN